MIEIKAMTADSQRLRDWRWGLLLVLATLAAYQPAWNGKPIWDDAAHLTYPELRSLDGLVRIWIHPGTTQQYYPVAATLFWMEAKLWGDATLGYHLVNILLHAASAFLLLKILRALQVPAAGLAAAIFALHPVQVESVAWISELKNTFSGVCYFGAALAYLRFDRTRSKAAYAFALALFIVGLMAKTVIATLPAALLVVFWWQRGKLSWKQDVLLLLPFFAAGIAAGFFTSWIERHVIGAQGAEFNFSLVERCLIAGRAIWFYLGKLFWPADLIFSYPRWKISHTIWWEYLYPAAAALLLGVLWFLRRWARGPLAALLYFVGTLFPALGFFNVYPFKFSFVADHFQYLACVGPIVAASVGVHAISQWFGERRLIWERVFCTMLLAALGLLTWRQSHIYTDIETLWQATIARNPDCWLAQNDLGALLYERGEIDQAIIRFRISLAIEPDNSDAQHNLGSALAKRGFVDEAILRFQKAVAIRPNFAEAHLHLGNAFLRKGQTNEAVSEFEKAVAMRPDLALMHDTLANALLQMRQVDEAIEQFEATLEIQPDDDQAHYNLGIALRQKGLADEAIVQFQKAVAIRPDFAEAQNNLGNCLLQKGRVDEAITHLRKALEVLPDYAQAHFNLGYALLQKGQVDEAIVQFQKLLAKQPEAVEPRKALAGIAWRLATSANAALRNGTKALALARQTDQLAHGNDPTMGAILAAAYAEAGHFEQAATTAQRALELATRQNKATLVPAIQAQLKCYEAGSPFRDTSTPPSR
jgi:Tfp pilus assembly protein PilF